jgi:uncharacterized protein YheU (UPF0270 family)
MRSTLEADLPAKAPGQATFKVEASRSRSFAVASRHCQTEVPMLIPYDQLEVDTLTRLIEDFVTRDGTDNGDDTPLETRVLRVRQALTKGQALIVFDPESEQCQLMLKHDVPKHLFD